jgi:hypothetical protein
MDGKQMKQTKEWQEVWNCAESDLEELRMVEYPSSELRYRVADYLSATVQFKRVRTASRGYLLHWLAEFVEKQQKASRANTRI